MLPERVGSAAISEAESPCPLWVGRKTAERRIAVSRALAKASVLHSLVGCRAATGNILIHDLRPWETALDGDSAVAMRRNQSLEQLVAEEENVLPTVERLPKTKQLHRIAK